MIKEWKENIEYNDGNNYISAKGLFEDYKLPELRISVFNEGSEIEILRPEYVYTDIVGLEYPDDQESQQILYWFSDSPFIKSWEKHIRETGQRVYNSYDENDRITHNNTIIVQ
ncbi:MAG: hypothetical protein IJ600_05335 [Lachnospiraceae bacterium]|nr:hypothetical protein [Lachnospiraceae bacterium]